MQACAGRDKMNYCTQRSLMLYSHPIYYHYDKKEAKSEGY